MNRAVKKSILATQKDVHSPLRFFNWLSAKSSFGFEESKCNCLVPPHTLFKLTDGGLKPKHIKYMT